MTSFRRRLGAGVKKGVRGVAQGVSGVVGLVTPTQSLRRLGTGAGSHGARQRVGLAPGTLVAREGTAGPARLHLIEYGPESFEETADPSLERCVAEMETPTVTWIDVTGTHDVEAIRTIGERFGLHPLVQEDLVTSDQRAKLEDYGGYLFVVVKMLRPAENDTAQAGVSGAVEVEQVGLVLGPGWVLSFQERPGDVFEPVRERLRQSSGRIRSRGADYLLYALLDVIVDHYFVTVESIGEHIEALEEAVLADPEPRLQSEISGLRREAIGLRKAVWPLREVLAAMTREPHPLVAEPTTVYLRDVYDHTIQVVDLVESARDVLASLFDLYLSALSHRMNEVMKVLTVVGTVFIPLSFLTGLYGMNFDNMPELHTENGYFVFLGVVVALLLGAVWYFRRKGWL